jgi:hypothetical protein
MSEQERTRCMCACDCRFLADLPPLYGGVRPLIVWRCPACKEAHIQKRGKCAEEPRVRIYFYRPGYKTEPA